MGYAYIDRVWNQGDPIELHLSMPVEMIQSHPSVRANMGKIALQKGPIVYCIEEVDNGANLPGIWLSKESKLAVEFKPDLLGGVNIITGSAERVKDEAWGNKLYKPVENRWSEVSFKAVPYYAWCNRKPGEMLVWIHFKE